MRRLNVLFLFCFVSCTTGTLDKGVFRKSGVAYRVRALPSWQKVNFNDNDLAFVDGRAQFLVGINSTCQGHKDAPLKVLSNDLLIGFEHKEFSSQKDIYLDKRAALQSRLVATLDGVPVELDLTVLKKDNCVYDFIYVAPRGRFKEYQMEYEEILATFTTEVN